MEDAVKWFLSTTAGGGLVWLCWWLMQQWFDGKKEWFDISIKKPLDENGKHINEIRRDLGVVKNSVSTLSRDISESFINLTTFVHAEFRAKPQGPPLSPAVMERIQILEKFAEKMLSVNDGLHISLVTQAQQLDTLKQIAVALNKTNKKLETEIVELRKDVLFIKNKKG